MRSLGVGVVLAVVLLAAFGTAGGAKKDIYAPDNLVAWCIVPFDAKNRSPEDRAEMMKRLGIKRYAYDWRAEHLPTFERELVALKKNGIELTAVWFPAGLGKEAQLLLDGLKKHGVKTQLWVSMGGGDIKATPEEQKNRVASHANALRPIAEAADKIGCTVALYNHGGWFGEPENQLAIIEHLKMPNVGIVYNQHHGHDHLARFPELLRKMMPHLVAFNLNGMIAEGDRKGKKILVLGQGDLDLGLLKSIKESGYTGPIGILGHTSDDAEERLRDNLDGLAWLLPQLEGKLPAPKPSPRTMRSPPATPGIPGWLAEGKAEYRTPPITVEVKAKLKTKTGYNILVASDTKASSAHWELFSMAGSGLFTVYTPGLRPDHVHSKVDIADDAWHVLAMQYAPDRITLLVDGKVVADQAYQRNKENIVPAGLAFARLVEGTIGCNGELAWAKISKGIASPTVGEPKVDDTTLGLWTFQAGQPAADQSTLKNPAKLSAAAAPPSGKIEPPAGPQIKAADPSLKSVLIDRSNNDAYMAIRPDGAGRLFVGGREAVFVFEPDGKGGFLPRQQLLKLPPDSIVIGIEYRGDDLYVQTVNALYLIPDGRVAREKLQPRRILWGVPQDLHVSFHCLAWGPQGDLYVDHGDPLLGFGDWSRPDHIGHWTLFAGDQKVPYNGTGAVLRMRPDGSGLKVVAQGLRGPVGLCFDRNWELFTNDNDHEGIADKYAPCRLLHVTPHIDFAWPRGWMASKSPGRSDLVEPVHSNMGRGVPCDQVFYDEPMIPALRGNLLLARWDLTGVTRFPLRPRGATFAAEEIPYLVGANNGRPTGIAVDQAGRIFVTTHYLGGNVVSPHCVSDLVMISKDGVAPSRLGDEVKATNDQLWAALSSDSGEARRRAHNEILRRGVGLTKETMKTAAAKFSRPSDDPFAVHWPWLVNASFEKLMSLRDERSTTSLFQVLNDEKWWLEPVARKHQRPEVRLQAVRALAEHRDAPRAIFVDALVDPSDPVKLAALAWFFDTPGAPPIDAVARLAAGGDPYLRQTAANLLARRATVADLEGLTQSGDAPTRLAGVLAAGIRLTVPPVHETPPAEVALSYPKGSSFFHREIQFLGEPKAIDLADLGRIGSYTMAQRWKAIKPSAEESRLFDLLAKALDDPSTPVKSQAAYYLSLLRDARTEPGIERVQRELKGGGLEALPATAVAGVWLAGPMAGELPAGPIDLAAEYPGKITWRKSDGAAGVHPVKGPTYAYFRISSRSRQPALLSTGGASRLWHNGRPVAGAEKQPTLLDLQPGSNDLLVFAGGDMPLSLAVRAKEKVTADAPEKADGAALAERLKSTGTIAPEILAVDWNKNARTGDIERGRKLFGSLGCMKCHAITSEQTGGGAPSLADVGRRFTAAYLVESILTPDKQVAPEFRATVVSLKNGQTVSGLLVRESGEDLELVLNDTSRRTVRTADVDERSVAATSPMPPGLVRSAAELRDLLRYLLSDRPTPP